MTFKPYLCALAVCAAGLCSSPARAQNAPPPEPATPLAEPAKTADPAMEPLPDWRVRRKELVHQLFGLQAAVETIPGTIFDTARNFPEEWGRKWTGVGKRYGNQYAQFLLSETIEFGVGTIHHEDPRYFRLGEGASVGRRAWYAFRSTWVARDASGQGERVALGRIAGVYGAWAIAQQWSPGSVQGVGQTLIWGSFGMCTKAGVNEIREFFPDWKHHRAAKRAAKESGN